MNWSIYPTFARFLVQLGPTTVSQLDKLHGADLRVALEGASPLQREMMLAAIQFHLRTPSEDGEHYLREVDGVYTNCDGSIVEEHTIEEQRATFEALQLTGVTFEEVMTAPPLTLHILGSTMSSIFHHTFLDALFLGRMTFIHDTGHEPHSYLLSSVTNIVQFYLPQQARAFVATVLLNEPELILNIRHKRREDSDHIFQKITSAHITAALNTVVHNPWAALYFLTHIEQMQDLVRNINANMIAGILNDQHVRQAFHTMLQDPRPEVVSLMLFRKYMNAEELRDAIYHEAITHTRGINDIALELAIAVVHAHNPRLITGPLHIGSMGGEVLHSDMAELIFNPLNAHDILQVIRAEEEYCEALELPLAKINSAMNIKAQLIIIILNASNNQYIIQALHGIMQDPQTMSFLSQNLDVVAYMLFRENMEAEELRDAIYNEVTTNAQGLHDAALELGITAIREHSTHLISFLCLRHIDGDRVLRPEIREAMLNSLNAHNILQILRMEEEYFDAGDQFDFEQQEQDAQIALAMNLSPELNFVSMDILLSS